MTSVLSLPSRRVQLPDLQLSVEGCITHVSIARRGVRHVVVSCAWRRSSDFSLGQASITHQIHEHKNQVLILNQALLLVARY